MNKSASSSAQYLHAPIRFLSDHFFQACCFAYAIPIIWYWLIGLNDGHAAWKNQIEWILTSYAASYFEHGLVRRGLIGTLLYPLDRDLLEAAFLALNIALIAFCVVLVDRTTRPAERADTVDPWSLAVIRALFAMSPFTVMYFAHAFGMLELPNLLLLFACIAAVERKNALLAVALSVIAVLVHEAFLLYGAPLITARLIQGRHESSELHSHEESVSGVRYRPACIYATVVAVTGLAVLWVGAVDQAALMEIGSGQDAYTRGIFQPSLGAYARETAILLAVTGGAYLWLYMVYSDNASRVDLLFLAALSPVTLFAFGVDYARWCAVIFAVVLTLVALRVIRDGWRIASGRTTWFAALFLLPVGPIGIGYFLPVLKSIYWLRTFPGSS